MVIILRTGSTTKHAVDLISDLLQQGKLKEIIGIPTSKQTHQQASTLGISLSDLDSHPTLDLAINGAEKVDPHLNLVKECGRSPLREKMIVGAAKKSGLVKMVCGNVEILGENGVAIWLF
ncbi:unnamed protein product [Linum tenue]|uniref:ribose-5-phosphate isomerase n=1 Tax=Linum tenue TaxID=586396 RepID=A0AAV0LAK9_9ROSI|nr:unnamed protein product [Linum tenue]CAI0431663.1 unnamed protein product [Linum tenue]